MYIPFIPYSLRPLHIIVIEMCELIHTPRELVSIPHRHVACHLLILLPPPHTLAFDVSCSHSRHSGQACCRGCLPSPPVNPAY